MSETLNENDATKQAAEGFNLAEDAVEKKVVNPAQADSENSGEPEAAISPDDEEALMAKAFEEAADPGNKGAQVQNEPLSQYEIDSLLGNDKSTQKDKQSGMERIISSGLIAYDRLPMLEVAFDRLVRILSTSLRNFTSDNVDVSFHKMTSLRFGEYVDEINLPALIGVFKAEEWDNYGLIIVDSAMIYSIIDVLLGGRRGHPSLRVEGRPFTTIERTLTEQLLKIVLADLTSAFDPLSPVVFTFERLEINPHFAMVTKSSSAAVVAQFQVEMEERGGRVDIVLPYATLEPVREILLQQFMGEKFGRDSIWEVHLFEALLETRIKLEAVLDERVMALSDIINLSVGSQLIFDAEAGGTVELKCGSVLLFTGTLGQRKKHLAVRIENKSDKRISFEN